MTKRTLLTLLVVFSLFLNSAFIYKKYKHEFIPDPIGNTHSFNRHLIYKVLPIKNEDIVFIGDSQTQFFNFSEYFNTLKIKNRGIMGDTSEGVLDIITDIAKQKPRKIFLQVGINDFWHDKRSVGHVVENYKAILKIIRKESPGSKIYIQSIFPTSEVKREIVTDYNKKLAALDGTYVDLYSSFNNNGELIKKFDSGDHLHLNGLGYQQWHDLLVGYVNE